MTSQNELSPCKEKIVNLFKILNDFQPIIIQPFWSTPVATINCSHQPGINKGQMSEEKLFSNPRFRYQLECIDVNIIILGMTGNIKQQEYKKKSQI